MICPCGNVEVKTASPENPDSPLPGRQASNELRTFVSGMANPEMASQALKTAALSEKLAEGVDFFVEVGEGGFEGFLVVGMCGRGEIVGDADAR